MRIRWLSTIRLLPSYVAMGALPALVELMFGGATPSVAVQDALAGVVYATCIAAPCSLTIPRALCQLQERSAVLRALATGSLLLFFAITGCFMANLILVAVHLFPAAQFGTRYWWSLRICLLITFTFGAVATVIGTLQGDLALAREELHRRQIAEERERKIAAEARFASLESRVHPHFLFNTLNSISALVREDPAEAERMIERLAALLRFSLDSELAGLVSLGEELKIVQDYLEIETVRFGARLRYRIESDPGTAGLMVPALSVQTLAENSVKYAVGARREGAEISISARLREGRLRVEVSDDGPGFEAESLPVPGHGLDLLKRRLAALFGPSASLEWGNADGRTLVAISLVP